jgi:hypothetical protein
MLCACVYVLRCVSVFMGVGGVGGWGKWGVGRVRTSQYPPIILSKNFTRNSWGSSIYSLFHSMSSKTALLGESMCS